MKVICLYSHCGPSFVRHGWRRVFEALGHEWIWWNPQQKSAFDIFSENEPDLFIGTTYDVDRAVFKNIVSRPNMKVILYASAWGELTDKVDRKKYPIVVASDEEKKTIERLKKETGNPAFVFIHVTKKYLEPTMSGWRSIGVEPLGILNAADTFVYLDGRPNDAFESDVAFVGGYWGYKGRNLDRYMLTLCAADSKLRVKIWGNQAWPVRQYLGLCEDNDVPHIFASAKVCTNVSEPHSTDLGFDVIERPFKVLSSGGFCVSDFVDEARELFTPEELVMAHTPKEFCELVRHYVAHPEERVPFIEAGRRKVLLEHTYYDRVAQMFGGLGMAPYRDDTLVLKSKFLQEKLF